MTRAAVVTAVLMAVAFGAGFMIATLVGNTPRPEGTLPAVPVSTTRPAFARLQPVDPLPALLFSPATGTTETGTTHTQTTQDGTSVTTETGTTQTGTTQTGTTQTGTTQTGTTQTGTTQTGTTQTGTTQTGTTQTGTTQPPGP